MTFGLVDPPVQRVLEIVPNSITVDKGITIQSQASVAWSWYFLCLVDFPGAVSRTASHFAAVPSVL